MFKHKSSISLAVVTALSLSACGGGGNGGSTPPPAVGGGA